MESLAAEVEPFGIHTTIIDPGFFRTELLTKESTNYATPSIEDYADRNAAQHEFWDGQNGQQPGDPAKLAKALLTIADKERPPRRFIAGAEAIAQAEQKVAQFQEEIDAHRDLSKRNARVARAAGWHAAASQQAPSGLGDEPGLTIVSRRGEPRSLVVHCGGRTSFLSRGFVREQSRLDCLELALGQRALRPQPRDFLELLDEFRR